MQARSLIAALAAGAACLALAQTMQRGPTRNPHGPINIPCSSCHTSIGWAPLRATLEFDHNRDTKFPLRGMHTRVECRLCHATLVFKEAGARCADCHADIHRRRLGANCGQCHSVNGWEQNRPQTQAHSARFPLMGAHASLECEACHKGAGAAQFAALPIQCGSCHMADYNNARIIDHRAAGFPVTCEGCHGVDVWAASTGRFDHARFTGFALSGAHAKLDCVACHVGNRYKGTPADCYSCHQADFTTAANPNHIAAGFPQDCSLCHSTASWAGATFDHSKTGFALTGAHAPLQCAACHTNGQFANLSAACASCHLASFNSATSPNHIASGFPQTCEVCHNTTAWTPASFNHNNTPFPLTGAHVSVACASCHVNNVFAGTPTDCYSCHKAEYQSTTNPNHAASAFPTTCADCHNTTAWTGATFNHTQFPIYSGTHAHAWTTCADCHTNSSNYQVFSCITCHTHAQANTDPDHRGVRNYVYSPTSCYSCHPAGQGGR